MKKMNQLVVVALMLILLPMAAVEAAATVVKQEIATYKIAFLPVMKAPMERETAISQLLTNEMVAFATEKKATFVDDALLSAVLAKHRYTQLDSCRPIDVTMIKNIQREVGADLVIAVRVEDLEQDSAAAAFGGPIRAIVKMQLVAATSAQASAWSKHIDDDKAIGTVNSEMGAEILAVRKFSSFLQGAWRQLK